MENNKTTRNVTSTNAGDDGEAVSKSPPATSFKSTQTPSKPIKTGWYVAVVRVNCEKRIATDIQEVLNSKGIWFEYWVPTIKDVVLDKRTKKRKTVERTFLSTFIFCHISTFPFRRLQNALHARSARNLSNPRHRNRELPKVHRAFMHPRLFPHRSPTQRSESKNLRRSPTRRRSIRTAHQRHQSHHRL